MEEDAVATAELEQRLGHRFRDRTLLDTALTHTSWLNEAAVPGRVDNERLEFLGDAVLALVTSDLLMSQLPDAAEGDLSRARAALVSEGGLARA
ncbi:MAG TPA: ribonuclease III domain-containing protein, partial [Polyangia bacterium]|nr:ribonuclease III domain-containing protein [Polyangia bacterium]